MKTRADTDRSALDESKEVIIKLESQVSQQEKQVQFNQSVVSLLMLAMCRLQRTETMPRQQIKALRISSLSCKLFKVSLNHLKIR